MKPRASLQASLLLAFAISIVLIFLVQLATRHLIELPQFYAQEYANDVNTVEQVKRAIALEMDRKRDVLIDNAHWRSAYDFVQIEKDSEEFTTFVDDEFSHSETMHTVVRVDGYVYFQLDGQVFFESNFDAELLAAGESLSLPLASMLPALPDDSYAATGGGFIDSPIGPVFFGITGITNEAASLAPVGYLVVWRKADAAFFDEVVSSLEIEYDHAVVATAENLIRTVRTNPQGVLPRQQGSTVTWLIDDINGEPIFVVRQVMPPRTFDDGLISASSLVGFSASALMLLFLAILVSRRVVRPIVELSSFATRVAQTEDYSLRIPLKRRDEIGDVASRFGQLLERVEIQEKALKLQNASLEELAQRDPLTGLANRRVFERVLERDWSHAKRTSEAVACIMIDVDCFKSYNDNYGHQTGDEALKSIARLLDDRLKRVTDCLCRYGGEEFVVLLLDTDVQTAVTIAESMVQSIASLAIPHAYSTCAASVTASAGVATVVPEKDEPSEILVRSADLALYRAKANGRNQVAVSDAKSTRVRSA